MKDDTHHTKRRHVQGNKMQKLLCPEMRQEIVRLTKQTEEFANDVLALCDNLKIVGDAIFTAQELAESVLDKDLSRILQRNKPTASARGHSKPGKRHSRVRTH
jgi:hypothetical protein